uniref:Uncharacterized protein n=1 Tax=Graphocephala atropunctata TaxID=36148 RepID=A0A1B6MRB6_9HEMI
MKELIFVLVVSFSYESDTTQNWKDKFSKLIEDGRTLNLSKTIRPNKFRGELAIHNKSHGNITNASNLGMEHLELHFNITNVFEDNSDNHPYSAHHYVEYEGEGEGEEEGLDNANITDQAAATINLDTVQDTLGKNIIKKKSSSKKAIDKALNAPVYLVFT